MKHAEARIIALTCEGFLRKRIQLDANSQASFKKPSSAWNHNFQPQPSHLNCCSGFALMAVLPQCGHFIVQI